MFQIFAMKQHYETSLQESGCFKNWILKLKIVLLETKKCTLLSIIII